MNGEDLAFASIERLTPLIRERQVSSLELTRTFLERIERHNQRLGAYITVMGEQALRSAEEADDAIARGEYRGPMHGIPIALKDQVYTRGVRTTAGSSILADFVPDEDATIVKKLSAAGAVLLGKLNLNEFAMGGTLAHTYGLPRNPWDLDRSPGGSSSGSGIAVAAGLSTASIGEDTAGSIRNPASFCGVVGVKPSSGTVSRHGIVPLSWSLDTAGPMTHTVRDCAWMLGAIAGRDENDRLTSRRPVPDYTSRLGQGVEGLRVGVLRELTQAEGVHPETRQAVEAAAEQLAGMGAIVDEVSAPIVEYAGAIYMSLCDVDNPRLHEQRLFDSPGDYDYATRVRLLLANLVPASMVSKAQRARALLRREMFKLMESVDVLVSPTTSGPAPPIEATQTRITTVGEVVRGVFAVRNNSTTFNMSGLPAVSVPCGFSSDGLPLGLQFSGRMHQDETIFQAAHAYEQANDWGRRRPAVVSDQ